MAREGLRGRFALFCDYSFITSDQKLSIIGEFDRLISDSPKPVLNRGYVVGSFEGPINKDFKIAVAFVSSKGKKIFPDKELTVKTGDAGRANVMIGLVNVVFEDLGDYYVKFTSGTRELCRASLIVIRPPKIHE